MKKKNVKNAKT